MDSELISQYLKKHLDLEFQIDIVSNEKEFVSAISTKPYHLILSDFMLPDIDGFQVLKYLHSFSKDIPVIILSGFIGEETAAELLKQGASDYVSKESLSRLDHSIKRALKEYSDQKKLEEAQQSLIRSEEKYRLLYTAMSQGLALHEIVTDERGKPVDYIFLDINEGANLDDNEWVSMKRHPESGWRILNTKVEFSEVAQFALCHHERFDGNGYPKGLKGDEIPIQARIIAVADAFDAMTSERSYRKPLRFDVAIQELRKCSGRQFDPKIVDIFIDIVSKFDPQKPACKDTDQIEEQFSKE